MVSVITPGYAPGEIVHVRDFPFEECKSGKSRYALVVGRDGSSYIVRGIYTRPRGGYRSVRATRRSGLNHDSYIGTRLVSLRPHTITHRAGEVDYDFDPFDDAHRLTP